MAAEEDDDLVVELDDETMRLLEARARANGRTAEDEAKLILALWVGLGEGRDSDDTPSAEAGHSGA